MADNGAPSPAPRWARHGCQASGKPIAAARLLPQCRAGSPNLAALCGESVKNRLVGLHPTLAHLCRRLCRTKRQWEGMGLSGNAAGRSAISKAGSCSC